MSVQEIPICFHCDTPVETDPVFEAPCGHMEHSSAVFHPLCLMEFREKRPEFFKEFRRKLLSMASEMMIHGAFDEEEEE